MSTANTIQPFSFYCQPVLPLVYDESLSYYETLCKVVGQLNTTGDAVNTLNEALTSEISARETADSGLDERLKTIEETLGTTHFMSFENGTPTSVMPTRAELYNWVQNGELICALYKTNEASRGQVYAVSCSYNAGDWGAENSNDFHFLIPLETTYNSATDSAIKQRIVKLTIPSISKQTLNTTWGVDILEVNIPDSTAEGVINLVASLSGETVTCSIKPSQFISAFTLTKGSKELCVAVNARFEMDGTQYSSGMATVSGNKVVISFRDDSSSTTSSDNINQHWVYDRYLIGDSTTNTWKVDSINHKDFDFYTFRGFEFTRKAGNEIVTDDDSNPASVAIYYGSEQQGGRYYQNLPSHLIDEVDGTEYWNGSLHCDSDANSKLIYTFVKSDYSDNMQAMIVRVVQLKAVAGSSVWTGGETWSYFAKEFQLPITATTYQLDVWRLSETATVTNGFTSYEAGSSMDFDDILPLVQSNQKFNAMLYAGYSETSKGETWSALDYSRMTVVDGVGYIAFSARKPVTLANGINAMNASVYFRKNSDGVKSVDITMSSALPAPALDGSDNGKIMMVDSESWSLKTMPTLTADEMQALWDAN